MPGRIRITACWGLCCGSSVWKPTCKTRSLSLPRNSSYPQASTAATRVAELTPQHVANRRQEQPFASLGVVQPEGSSGMNIYMYVYAYMGMYMYAFHVFVSIICETTYSTGYREGSGHNILLCLTSILLLVFGGGVVRV